MTQEKALEIGKCVALLFKIGAIIWLLLFIRDEIAYQERMKKQYPELNLK